MESKEYVLILSPSQITNGIPALMRAIYQVDLEGREFIRIQLMQDSLDTEDYDIIFKGEYYVAPKHKPWLNPDKVPDVLELLKDEPLELT